MRQPICAAALALTLQLVACHERPPGRPASPAAVTPTPDALAPTTPVTPTPATAPSPPAPAQPRQARYLPFRIQIDGASAFREVTFKEVGAARSTDLLNEAIAESLSRELAGDPARSLRTSVQHDPRLLDPRAHLSCEAGHLYVDFWRTDQRRWGYSLWSGCGHDDRFAWREIDLPAAADAVDHVTPLTQSIAHSLRQAATRGCYQRTC